MDIALPQGPQGSIARRLMLGTGLLALLCFVLAAALCYWISSRALVASSRTKIGIIAQQQSASIASELAATFKSNDALVQALLAERAGRGLQRDAIDALFRRLLLANPEWVGTGAVWEPHVLDKDSADVGLVYWTWDNARVPLYDSASPDQDHDWFTLPRKLRRPVLLEPYADETVGREGALLMTTLATPIIDGETYLGAVFTDYALSGLQQRLSMLHPLESGHVELISPGGMVLGSRDAAQIGTHRRDPGSRAMLAAIAAGQHYEQLSPDADGNVRIYVPLSAGLAQERFALGVVVPYARLSAEFVQQARQMLWILALAGIASVGGVSLYLLLLLRRQLVKPLAGAIAVAENVAAGRLDSRISIPRDDEIGHLLGAMARMQGQLKAVIDAQAEMARKHDEGTISFRIDESVFPGDYGRMVRDTNALVASHVAVKLRLVEVMRHYAVGNLSEDMDRLPGEKAVLTQTMDTVKANLSSINAEIKHLAMAAAAGDFGQRGDVERYQHEFRAMISGLNLLMQTADGNLAELSQLLHAIAAGDLTGMMEGEFHGVFAQMRDDANVTVTQLTSIVDRIQLAAAAIDTAATEIASGNDSLSCRTEQQAVSLEETASSMAKLTSTVRANAERAHLADQAAQRVGQAVQETVTAIGEVVQVMTQINESSARIADIITVIDGIAFQTNILALNAAVESARAGEQGRGFAVVAGEVRTLAQRSAIAAKEIKVLIQESGRRVENGLAISRRSEQAIAYLIEGATSTNRLINEIAAASAAQATDIEQVNHAVVQMDRATQQNAALVDEAANAARSLGEQAHQLIEAASVFRTNRALSPSSVPSRERPPRGTALPTGSDNHAVLEEDA